MKNLIQNVLEMNLDNDLIILLVTIFVLNFKSVHLNDIFEKIFYVISVLLLFYFLGNIILDFMNEEPFSLRNGLWGGLFLLNTIIQRKIWLKSSDVMNPEEK